MTSLHNLSDYDAAQIPDASGLRFGIVVADWNPHITHKLYEGCEATLQKHGVQQKHLHVIQVPGSFELTAGARMLLAAHTLDAVICLGCVIKGETSHNEYINHAVATGLSQLSIASGKPVIFGLLTPNDEQQAIDRAGGKYGNKGVEAAQTAIRMAALAQSIGKKPDSSIGFFDS